MAVVTSSESINIACSPEEAFALLVDVSQHKEIFGNLEVRDFHGGKAKVGDSWVSVDQFMGREVTTRWTLTERDAPNKVVFTGESDAGDLTFDWTIQEAGGDTLLEYTSQAEPKGFLATVAIHLMKGSLEKKLSESMERMKMRLEA